MDRKGGGQGLGQEMIDLCDLTSRQTAHVASYWAASIILGTPAHQRRRRRIAPACCTWLRQLHLAKQVSLTVCEPPSAQEIARSPRDSTTAVILIDTAPSRPPRLMREAGGGWHCNVTLFLILCDLEDAARVHLTTADLFRARGCCERPSLVQRQSRPLGRERRR